MHRVAQGQLDRDRAISIQAANHRDLHSSLAQIWLSEIREVTGVGTTAVQKLFVSRPTN